MKNKAIIGIQLDCNMLKAWKMAADSRGQSIASMVRWVMSAEKDIKRFFQELKNEQSREEQREKLNESEKQRANGEEDTKTEGQRLESLFGIVGPEKKRK